jgi:hypothetical protein
MIAVCVSIHFTHSKDKTSIVKNVSTMQIAKDFTRESLLNKVNSNKIIIYFLITDIFKFHVYIYSINRVFKFFILIHLDFIGFFGDKQLIFLMHSIVFD